MRNDPTSIGWEGALLALLRPALLLAFWACLAATAATLVLAALPPGLDGWAQLLAKAIHAHRHHRHASALLDEAGLRSILEATFYACWAATGALAVGLLVSWRLLFGGLHRWGTDDRY